MSKYQAPRGTQDLFLDSMNEWQQVEARIREVASLYNLSEIRTPVFEHTEVFNRKNDSSDVVNKEMYTFKDNSDRSLTLKPEGTAGLIRSYVENKLYSNPEPLHKFYYITPAFRYERPQKGRMRIHHQFGVEFLGHKSPLVDVQAMLVGIYFVKSFGLKNVVLHINTLGDDESRSAYREALKQHFESSVHELCTDCHRRYEQNPLRILDCKVDAEHPSIVNAPKMSDYLNQASKEYFEEVLALLDEFKIEYVIDSKLVRGLDYYTHTVFELKNHTKDTGSQDTLFGGGRYDHLVEEFDGPQVSSVGFGLGLERFILMLKAQGLLKSDLLPLDVYGLSLGQSTQLTMLSIIEKLRNEKISCDFDVANRSMKAQFKSADRSNAKILLILGDDEQKMNTIRVKNMMTQQQVELSQNEIVDYVKKQLTNEENSNEENA